MCAGADVVADGETLESTLAVPERLPCLADLWPEEKVGFFLFFFLKKQRSEYGKSSVVRYSHPSGACCCLTGLLVDFRSAGA